MRTHELRNAKHYHREHHQQLIVTKIHVFFLHHGSIKFFICFMFFTEKRPAVFFPQCRSFQVKSCWSLLCLHSMCSRDLFFTIFDSSINVLWFSSMFLQELKRLQLIFCKQFLFLIELSFIFYIFTYLTLWIAIKLYLANRERVFIELIRHRFDLHTCYLSIWTSYIKTLLKCILIFIYIYIILIVFISLFALLSWHRRRSWGGRCGVAAPCKPRPRCQGCRKGEVEMAFEMDVEMEINQSHKLISKWMNYLIIYNQMR